MADRRSRAKPTLTVLAGVNGAGKSSIAGAMLRGEGGAYFNPDEAARRLRKVDPRLTPVRANSLAWAQGVELLRRAIETRKDFAFETTLGGNTIFRLLESAADAGFDVCVWYAGLESPELHLARVAARVRRGGHDIPETDVRRRYDNSRLNLVRLLPRLAELLVYDNSEENDPASGDPPTPLFVLHVRGRKIVAPKDLSATPEWAKPIVAAALKLPPHR